MQQVNSLPIILSQDHEFSDKSSHGTSAESSNCFSVLVERYLDNTTETSDKSEGKVVTNSSSKDDKGQNIAADGKVDTNQSIEKSLLSEDQLLQQQELDKKNSIENTSGEEVKTKAALTESEEFISLLYYSDNALVDKEQQTKNNSNGNNKGLGDEATLLVSDIDKATSNVKNENITKNDSRNIQSISTQSISIENINTENINTENINTENNTEHKLKTFISDNSIKTNDVLTRYQQSLSVKKDTLNSGQTLSTTELSSNELDETGLETISNRENVLLTGGKQTKEKPLSQVILTGEKPLTASISSESVSKELGKVFNNSGVESTTDVENGNNEGKSSSVANGKVLDPNSANVVTDEKLISNSNTSKKDSVEVVKASVNTSNKTHQVIIDENISQSVNNEKVSNAVATENKVLATQPGHIESVVKASAVHQQNTTIKQSSADEIKEQYSINTESVSEKNISLEEYVLAEDEFALATKASDISLKNDTSQTSNVNQIRPLSDIHNQATQVKHETSAYSAYEAALKVDQSAVSEVVQTQKNNVQLHQETISIFRKDFAEAVKDKVMLVISQKLQQFDITLDPPEFGNMQVRVNLQGEQAAVNFVVQNQSAKEAIEQNMHKLKEMLAEQGVDVGGADVQQQNQHQSEKGDDSAQGSKQENLHSSNSTDSSEHILSAELVNSSASGVDYYV